MNLYIVFGWAFVMSIVFLKGHCYLEDINVKFEYLAALGEGWSAPKSHYGGAWLYSTFNNHVEDFCYNHGNFGFCFFQ